jgi:hypothetical protein
MRAALTTSGTYLNAGVVALGLILGTCAESERIAAEPVSVAPAADSPAAPPDRGAGDALQPARAFDR